MPLPTVNAISPPPAGWSQVFDYAGGNAVVYIGQAKSNQGENSSLVITSVSTAAAAVVTSVAHGLRSDNLVTIAGGTGDWAALNGSRIITVLTADTFSVAVNSTGFALTFGGTIVTQAPQTSKGSWSIEKLYYDSGGLQIGTAWCKGNSSASFIWDNRASYDYA